MNSSKNIQVKSISLIYPCHNEEQSIPLYLPKILESKKKILDETLVEDLEIIVVNDGSTDSSKKLLEKYKENIKIINLAIRKGYGYSIKEGLKHSKKAWIAFCDLDNTCEPMDLKKLVEGVQQKSVRTAWGNRLHKNSSIFLMRKLGNQFYKYCIFLLSFTLIPDPCSGFRLFHKETFKDIHSFPNDLSFSLALTVYCIRHKINFHFVDINYKERLGQSKLIPFKDGFVFLFTLFKTFFK